MLGNHENFNLIKKLPLITKFGGEVRVLRRHGKELYIAENGTILTIDGVKIDFPDGWVHLRTSNTEPILRVYAESTSMEKANKYARDVIELVG